MIEERVRELVADIEAAWTPAQRIDQIAGLEAGIGMLQAAQNVEAVTYVDQRRMADKAAGVGAGSAGGARRSRSRWPVASPAPRSTIS